MMTRFIACLMILFALPASAEQPIPVIGVAGGGPDSMSVRFTMAALVDAGAYPVLLDTRKPDALTTHLNALNGVIIAGNSLDINPADYGASAHPKTKDEDALAKDAWAQNRDDYEYALIDAAIKTQLPFLGICSGAQRLNVQGGGTLSQHIDGQLIWAEDKRPHTPVLAVNVVADSRLANLTQQTRFQDNSLHHQHIDQVRSGFTVAARDEASGITEAIEPAGNSPYASHPFLLGVQWHPEYGASAASKKLMKAFVEHASKHAALHPMTREQANAVDASAPWLRDMVQLGAEQMRQTYGYKKPDMLTR